MLGGVYEAAAPVVTPGSIVVMYGFDQTYYAVPSLVMEPGRGYWVNLTSNVVNFSLGGSMLAGWGEGGLGSIQGKETKSIASAGEGWQIALRIIGNELSPGGNFNLTIGCGQSPEYLPAPPPPPDYSVWGELYPADGSGCAYFTMIQPADFSGSAVWLLALDPNGNLPPVNPQISTVQWNPGDLPQNGDFYIEDYSSGEIVVEDMRRQASFEIEGSETHYFNIVQLNESGVKGANVTPPYQYFLGQNSPNPFNPCTRISYCLKETGKVNLTVYNILGEEVAVLAAGIQAAGNHSVDFHGADLPSGVYLYRLQAGKFCDIKKMVIIK